ncbi:MAG TPA: hydrogenase nickel incorporation protein HypB [Candidatus Heimdallarchaeota archaeon]|nr:hydrogenase nickel incorporation protein HypB [Candidatus Heimdallarchaeota archaeon]
MMEIKVLKDILSANDQRAKENRELMDRNGIFAINITASPGAGKTSLIMETIRQLKAKTKIGVIEGDVSSSIDAETVAKEGIPVVQINTGGTCHLDATMLSNAFDNLPLQQIDLLFIENVGNLICPASFALGEDRNVLVASVPEGDDKPHKYPVMFSNADLVVLNKIDLLPHVDFDLQAFCEAVRGLNEKAHILEISCKTGQGTDRWVEWLANQLSAFNSPS